MICILFWLICAILAYKLALILYKEKTQKLSIKIEKTMCKVDITLSDKFNLKKDIGILMEKLLSVIALYDNSYFMKQVGWSDSYEKTCSINLLVNSIGYSEKINLEGEIDVEELKERVKKMLQNIALLKDLKKDNSESSEG